MSVESALSRPSRWRIDLLEWDPALADGISQAERERAESSLPAPAVSLRPGEWRPDSEPPAPGHLGYLIGEGLLIRRLKVAAGRSLELLRPGDLLRPWQEDSSSFCEASWEVLEATTLILLEPPVARQLAHWPEIVANLVARGLRRARFAVADAAVSHIVGVENRVLTLLWQLAETSGKVSEAGVRLDLHLPHRVIAELLGARRPTVTSAISSLQNSGRIESTREGGWLLVGASPC
jgi:hypothetical protein